MPDNRALIEQLARLPRAERIRLLKEREAEIAAQQKALADYTACFPYAGFVPHPGQYRALQLIQKGVDDGKLKGGIFPGNGWGKSTLLGNLLWNIMCERETGTSWFFRQPWIVNWKWPKHIRLVCMADDLKDQSGEMWKMIDQWWPKGEYETQKQDHPYVSMYRHKRTGFIMDVKTFDQEAKQHESSTLGAVFFNEPPPSSIWSVYPMRFRKGGLMLAFATLVSESEFFKDDVIDSPDAFYTYGDVHENCSACSKQDVEIEGRSYHLEGHLEHDQIERTIRNAPYHEREARRTGRPVHLAGAALPIVPEVHFIDRDKIPPLSELVTASVTDPHQRRPWAMIVGGIDALGNYYVLDEWPRITTEPWKMPYHKITSDDRGLTDYANIIRAQDKNWSVNRRIIDAKFAAQNIRKDGFNTSLRRDLAVNHGLGFVDGNTHVRGKDGGIRLLTNLLGYDKNRAVDFSNSPRFFVARDCWNTCYQLQNVTWAERANPDQYGRKEELDEKLLDYVRLCMYLVMDNFRWTPQEQRAEQRSEIDLEQERKALERVSGVSQEAIYA